MKPEPIKITFRGGPLAEKRNAKYIQIFASDGSDGSKPDQYVKGVVGTYTPEMQDEHQIVYVWKGASK